MKPVPGNTFADATPAQLERLLVMVDAMGIASVTMWLQWTQGQIHFRVNLETMIRGAETMSGFRP